MNSHIQPSRVAYWLSSTTNAKRSPASTTGALIGLGIPEYQAKRYEGRMRNGGILMSVHADDQPLHLTVRSGCADQWRTPPLLNSFGYEAGIAAARVWRETNA